MLGKLLQGRYQVVQVLSTGGFCQTYLALDTHGFGYPTCVVKHLKAASSDSSSLQTIRRLFTREAEALEKLGNYDQIPEILAHFEEDQEFYLVQEFIEGHTLSEELPPGNCWTESQVVQMLQEVLGILEVVHSHGLIHRDIKPSNLIRRQQDSRLVLIDFGSVKQAWTQVVTSQGQTSSTFVIGTPSTIAIGTPGYMPTEQERGRARPCSDIYALGMIGIQALTGLNPTQLPDESDTGELIWQHQAQVSAGLASVLKKMVRYHFKDRYQSASEVLQALQQLASPHTPTAQATVAGSATTLVDELTLKWSEPEPLRTETIRDKQPSKNPGTVVSTYTNRLTLIIKLSIVTLVSLGAGYAYLQWRSHQGVQPSLEEIKKLKTTGEYKQCVSKAKEVPQNSPISNQAQALLNQCQLVRSIFQFKGTSSSLTGFGTKTTPVTPKRSRTGFGTPTTRVTPKRSPTGSGTKTIPVTPEPVTPEPSPTGFGTKTTSVTPKRALTGSGTPTIPVTPKRSPTGFGTPTTPVTPEPSPTGSGTPTTPVTPEPSPTGSGTPTTPITPNPVTPEPSPTGSGTPSTPVTPEPSPTGSGTPSTPVTPEPSPTGSGTPSTPATPNPVTPEPSPTGSGTPSTPVTPNPVTPEPSPTGSGTPTTPVTPEPSPTGFGTPTTPVTSEPSPTGSGTPTTPVTPESLPTGFGTPTTPVTPESLPTGSDTPTTPKVSDLSTQPSNSQHH